MIDVGSLLEHLNPIGKAIALTALVTAVIVFPLTLWLGYAMFHVETAATGETFAPGYTQSDERHSRVADRIPTAKADLPPAPHNIPKGKQEVRRITVTVAPRTAFPVEPSKPDASGLCPVIHCPATTVDLSLVQEKEGSYRAVASSPDGEVITALDIPILEFGQPQPKNAITLMGNRLEGVFSASYSRRFRLFNRPVDAAVGFIHTDSGRDIPVAGGTLHY